MVIAFSEKSVKRKNDRISKRLELKPLLEIPVVDFV